MLYHVCAFAGSISDEEHRTLLQVFCKAVFVYYDRGGFSDLGAVWGEYCRVYLHSACVDHRDDEAEIPGQVGIDGQELGVCLSHQSVEGADCKEWFSGTETETLGGGYPHAKAGV